MSHGYGFVFIVSVDFSAAAPMTKKPGLLGGGRDYEVDESPLRSLENAKIGEKESVDLSNRD
jgi:hypothetical protein